MSAHPATKPMLMFVEAMQNAHAPKARVPSCETMVGYTDDAAHPGRTAITITGPTQAAVQAEITRLMLSAENMGNSFAQFLNPGRLSNGAWSSRGEVVVTPTDEQVAG